ncbi:amidohydrolase [Frankia sp. CNm7]|uniref:Amidohydrolase n=1 Tax=Frankia nepalensis TaxID=1836974 RepID=A0A937RMM9_9ACTN|nr:amidohydrolase [Frankia nepalensis]MBL7496163.1 amidohydrolase [Frankia nepalensis]MBL7508899.1 amidohydrolase [Frankia nepalensis]MBL7516739.1 amidohydrolase [Frankia nepalensis]MBL7628676.1 amidohydrolase [Frankia nepalensis]
MSDADLVFIGGPVFTADAARTRTHAVAVRGGRIVAVGRDAEALVGSSTEVVDLAGKLLVPGFQDAHVHPAWGGLDLLRCHLGGAHDRAGYLAAVAAYARAHPGEEWILGGGWSMPAFPGGTPLAADLDVVVPDRPVMLMNRDGHGAWVNSRALELAGVDARTPDPADGRIERDAAGTPTGTLHEGAIALVSRLVPPDTPERMVEALLRGQEYLHSFGVTAWQDAIVGTYGNAADPAPAYLALARSGRLTARVVGALWFERDRGVEQLDDLRHRRETYSHGRFRATTVKIMQDGVPENFTAAMLDPYLSPCGCGGHGDRSGRGLGSGIAFFPREVLLEAVPALDAAGFQVHFHAIGDRAVRDCLDAVERAIAANGRGDLRHHIAHLQVVHPDDVGRFGQLGVAANLQFLWAVLEAQMIELNLPFLGAERAAWQYPFRGLQQTGAVLAAGSDWSVSTPNPLAALHVAVNRTPAPTESVTRAEHEVFLPEQRLDLASALAAYTSGSAWVNHLDDVTGTVTVGKEADLVVLDRDPFAGPAGEIGETRVLQTFVAGTRVYAAPDG